MWVGGRCTWRYSINWQPHITSSWISYFPVAAGWLSLRKHAHWFYVSHNELSQGKNDERGCCWRHVTYANGSGCRSEWSERRPRRLSFQLDVIYNTMSTRHDRRYFIFLHVASRSWTTLLCIHPSLLAPSSSSLRILVGCLAWKQIPASNFLLNTAQGGCCFWFIPQQMMDDDLFLSETGDGLGVFIFQDKLDGCETETLERWFTIVLRDLLPSSVTARLTS